MNLFGISGVCNFLTSVILSLFLFFNVKGKILVKLWAYHALVAAIWGLGTIFIAITPEDNIDAAYFWWRIAYAGLTFLPALYYHFVCEFVGIKREFLIRFFYTLSSFFLLLNIMTKDLFIGKLHYKFNQFYWTTQPGIFLWLYIGIFVFGVIIFAHIELLRVYFGIKNRKKRTHLLYFAVGGIIGWIGGWSCYLENFDLGWYPVGNFCINLYPILLGYAIYKYQLMDIEVIVKRTLVFAGLFAMSYAVISGFAYIGSIFFESVLQNRWMALVPSVFVIVLVLRPLEAFLRNATDKYLFQKKYDYKELLSTFTEEVITVLELDVLTNLTVHKLVEIMKLNSASIFLYDEDTEEFKTAALTGPEAPKCAMKNDEKLVEYIRKSGTYVLLDDPSRKKGINPAIEEKLKELNAMIVIPLIYRENMVGMLSLGSKKSDELMAQEDIDILMPLAGTLSIAITNAKLFVELSQSQARAAQGEKMAVIGTLSAGINHEICNPLGIARGQCEMFLLNIADGVYKDKDPQELLKKAEEIMGKVMHETDRATAITKKLSSFAKPAKGEMTDDVNVVDELEEAVSLIEHELKLDNIHIIREIEDKLPCIMADKKQIQEIFFNIVRNAAQAMEEAGKITVRASSDGKRVRVDIEDTGSGISKKNLDQIFAPFFTTKEPGKGTGLGLFIVKQVVERNNGHISVESELGKGTIFHLDFEAAASQKSKKSKGETA